MAANRRNRYLISYDIADPKRLARVHRYLLKQGLPLQYSVFSLYLSQRKLEGLLAGLDDLIDAREDDIRVYPLPDSPECRLLGRQMMPADVLLFRSGGDLMGIGTAIARQVAG